jgi:hypothetical protein
LTSEGEEAAAAAAAAQEFGRFGRLREVTLIPDRHFCFVNFVNVEDAKRAKGVLQVRAAQHGARLDLRFPDHHARLCLQRKASKGSVQSKLPETPRRVFFAVCRENVPIRAHVFCGAVEVVAPGGGQRAVTTAARRTAARLGMWSSPTLVI